MHYNVLPIGYKSRSDSYFFIPDYWKSLGKKCIFAFRSLTFIVYNALCLNYVISQARGLAKMWGSVRKGNIIFEQPPIFSSRILRSWSHSVSSLAIKSWSLHSPDKQHIPTITEWQIRYWYQRNIPQWNIQASCSSRRVCIASYKRLLTDWLAIKCKTLSRIFW